MAEIKPLTGNFGDFSGIVLKAAARGHIEAVRHYLTINPGWLNQEGPHGRTLVWEAVYKGRLELVRELLQRGAEVSPMGSYYTPMLVELSPLALAQAAGRDELVELLRSHGAEDDIYAASHRGDCPAIIEFLNDDPRLVNRPSRECEPHPYMGFHPVHYAVAGKRLEALTLLVDRGAAVEQHLPLLTEWASDSPRIRKYLRSLAGGRTIQRPPTAAQKKARRTGVPAIDRPNRMGFPPLVEACRGNHNAPDAPERVEHVLNKGADIRVRDYKDKTALHRAAQAGFLLITELLIDRGADLEADDSTGGTPLFDAAYHGRTQTAELLLARGANVNHSDRKGQTPLFVAARRGRLEIVRSLLQAGADPAHLDNRGRTPHDATAAARSRSPDRRQILRLLQ